MSTDTAFSVRPQDRRCSQQKESRGQMDSGPAGAVRSLHTGKPTGVAVSQCTAQFQTQLRVRSALDSSATSRGPATPPPPVPPSQTHADMERFVVPKAIVEGSDLQQRNGTAHHRNSHPEATGKYQQPSTKKQRQGALYQIFPSFLRTSSPPPSPKSPPQIIPTILSSDEDLLLHLILRHLSAATRGSRESRRRSQDSSWSMIRITKTVVS